MFITGCSNGTDIKKKPGVHMFFDGLLITLLKSIESS